MVAVVTFLYVLHGARVLRLWGTVLESLGVKVLMTDRV